MLFKNYDVAHFAEGGCASCDFLEEHRFASPLKTRASLSLSLYLSMGRSMYWLLERGRRGQEGYMTSCLPVLLDSFLCTTTYYCSFAELYQPSNEGDVDSFLSLICWHVDTCVTA